MTDPLAKVRPGQPLRIPAAAFNAFVDAAKATRGFAAEVSRDPQREQAQALVPVKNTTLATIPRFGVLGVDAPLFPPDGIGAGSDAFKRRMALKGSAPSDAAHFGRFVIATEPIAPGAVGMACGSGLCAVQVEFPVDPVGLERRRRYADIADAATDHLKAGDMGSATVVWKEAGDGVRWAVVRLGGFADSRSFPVDLTPVGGSGGDAATPASWLYDVQDAGAVLALGVDPTAPPHNWTRPPVGGIEFATAGLAHYDDNDQFVLDWINETAKPRWSFPILMTRVGGKDGTSDTPATWAYDIADAITGASIATGVDPTQGLHEWRRPPRGKMTQASFGYATLTSAGVFKIGWTNEAPVVPGAAVFGIILAVAEQDSGGATAPANHTYNITDEITGASLGTFINPAAAPHKYKRPAVGRLAPANYGLAFMRQANAVLDPDLPDAEELVITWINEVPDVGACA